MPGFDNPVVGTLMLCLAAAAAVMFFRNIWRQRSSRPEQGPQIPPENRAKALFQSALFGCIETNREGVVTAVNKSECQFRRLPPEQMLRAHIWDLERDPKQAEEQFRKRCFGHQDPAPWRRDQVRPDGSLDAADVQEMRLRDETGQVAGCLVVSVDVSDRQRTEDALVRTTGELKAIFDAFPDSFLRVNSDGSLLDYKPSRDAPFTLPAGYAGKKMREYIEGEAGERLVQAVESVRKTKQTCSAEFPVAGKNGVRHFEARLAPIGWNEVMVLVRDITGRKQADEQIRQFTEELQAKNEELAHALIATSEATKLKSRFVANMSHEIRTPVNGIMGMTELLLEAGLSAEQQECAESISRSAAALLKVIENVLDLSKLESGALKVQRKPFDLRKIVKEALDQHSLVANFKGLALKCVVAPDIPRVLVGDPERLRQVLSNLVENAVKFTEQGGVSVDVAMAGPVNGGATLRFRVEDTGIGIHPAEARKLFASFVQGDASSTRKAGGSGLGLAISKQLVAMMGGEIAVDSQPGKGSAFSFTAVFEKHESSSLEESEAPSGLRDVRILVAEHERSEQSKISGLLDFWGCRHHESPAGQDVARVLRSLALEGHACQVALIAVDRPEQDALAVAHSVKSDSVVRDIVLIAMLPPSMRTDGQSLRAIGFNSWVQKPVQASDLYDTIFEELRSIRTVSAEPPAEAAKPAPSPKIVPYTPKPARRSLSRILLAEDDGVNQKILLRMLEKMGHKADAVFDGERAVEAATASAYDLVLMDLQMPRMDGLEATAAIRFKEGNTRHTPIVAVTANAMPGDRERCLAAGMDDYLSKPVSLERLRTVVLRWLEQRPGERYG